MPDSCTHPIYKLRNPQPIRHEGVIVGAEGPCLCGANWARSYFLGQTGDHSRKNSRDMREAGGGARGRSLGHGGPSRSESFMGTESTEDTA